MPTSEQLEIQALARDFSESELRPHSADWDSRRGLDDEVFDKLAELGFLGMLIPDDFGGLGFDLTTYILVLEELGWGDPAVALTVALHNGPVATLLTDHGTPEQKARWLPALADGSALGTFALPERWAGTEASSVGASATRDQSGFRLRGALGRVTNGGRAGLVVTALRTEGGGPGVFLVTPAAAGYHVGERERTLGFRASETVPVELRDVLVGSDALVGEADSGVGLVSLMLDVARLGTAAQALGIGRAAMEHAAEYALGREQFGEPIAGFGAIKEKLAGMAERLAAGRALALEAAVALQAHRNGGGRPRGGLAGVTARAAIAKLAASEAATWAADEAIQVFGGYGYMRHYPVEKLLRDATRTEISEGTGEILRQVIAGELLRELGQVSE